MTQAVDLLDIGDHVHCDDYLRDPAANPIAKRYIEHARHPGHGMRDPRPWPRLFANYRGVRVRVVMASRLGDLGITTNLNAENGYDARVFVDQLTAFSESP